MVVFVDFHSQGVKAVDELLIAPFAFGFHIDHRHESLFLAADVLLNVFELVVYGRRGAQEVVATHFHAVFASLGDVSFEFRVGVSGTFGGFDIHKFYVLVVGDGFPIDVALIFRHIYAVVVGSRQSFHL